jgi:hypothetical protein
VHVPSIDGHDTGVACRMQCVLNLGQASRKLSGYLKYAVPMYAAAFWRPPQALVGGWVEVLEAVGLVISNPRPCTSQPTSLLVDTGSTQVHWLIPVERAMEGCALLPCLQPDAVVGTQVARRTTGLSLLSVCWRDMPTF